MATTNEQLYFGLTGQNIPANVTIDDNARKLLLAMSRSAKQAPMIVGGRKYIQMRQQPDIIAMSGYMFAVRVWQLQIAPMLTPDDYANGFTLVMPSHVELTTDSFLDHIIGTIAHNADLMGDFSKFKFYSENVHVQNDINKIIVEYANLLKQPVDNK